MTDTEHAGWYDCPHCVFRHPFEITAEKPCPNVRLTEAQCQRFHSRPLARVLKSHVLASRLSVTRDAVTVPERDASVTVERDADQRKRDADAERARRYRERQRDKRT